MTRHVLLDTGPLVAFVHLDDAHHAWARQVWAEIAPPLATCEAVLAEACHLLRDLPGGSDAVVELVARDVVRADFRLQTEVTAVRALMRRYADTRMSLADACLVRMSEVDSRSTLLTLDRDFRVYRRHGRQAIPVMAPSGR